MAIFNSHVSLPEGKQQKRWYDDDDDDDDMMGSKHCFAQGSKIFGVIQGGKFFEKKAGGFWLGP